MPDFPQGPSHEAAGFPAKPSFERLFFNHASGTVLVLCRDRAVGHSGRRLFHRRVGASRYLPTVDVTETGSVDTVVVASEAPTAVALVREWKKRGECWAEEKLRLVSIDLAEASPKLAEIDTAAVPRGKVSDLLSISDDGRCLYCVCSVAERPDAVTMIMHYGVYRWQLRPGLVELVANLPGIAW